MSKQFIKVRPSIRLVLRLFKLVLVSIGLCASTMCSCFTSPRALGQNPKTTPTHSTKPAASETGLTSKKQPELSEEQKKELVAKFELINNQLQSKMQNGRLDEVLAMLEQLFEIQVQILGPASPELLGTLDLKCQIAQATGKFAAVIQFRQQAVEVGTSLYRNGDYRLADLERAVIYSQQFSALTKDQRDEVARAASIDAKFFRLRGEGKASEAVKLAKDALEIYEKVLGKEHRNYGLSLYNLAILHHELGDYSRAELLLLEVKTLATKVLGKEHPDYAANLSSLALLYKEIADYAQAEPLFLEAKAIQEKALSKEHPNYATNLNNLGLLYHSMGDYAKAEPLYLECKAIRERILGNTHPSYATSLNNLAGLYTEMGDYLRAEPLYVESKRIREIAHGHEHTLYALSLHNLAGFYTSIREYEHAEALYLEAKTIQEKVHGKEHASYAASLSSLAGLYYNMGEPERAEPLYLEAKAIRERVLGKDHPDYALVLNNLATLYCSMADYLQADSLLLEVKSIQDRSLGKEHPHCAGNLNNLAFLRYVMGDYVRAEPLYEDAMRITRRHLESTASILSERQQMAMDQSLRLHLNNYIQLCLDANVLPQHSVENVLLWKGSIQRRLRGLRIAADDPTIAEQFTKLQRSAMLLSKVAQQIPNPDQAEPWRANLAQLTNEKEQLESELMRLSSAYDAAVKPITLAEIQQAIPEDGVLVDFLEFNGKGGRELLASIVWPKAESKMLSLGSVKELHTRIDTWRESYGASPAAKEAGQQLRKQIWEPLLPHLGDTKTILISNDGALGRLPLAALPGKQPGSYLIEDHRLTLIPVPQLLPALMQRGAKKQLLHELLLIGDVDYSNNPPPNTTQEPYPRKRPWERGDSIASVRGDTEWTPLKETGLEVEFIRGMYQRLFNPGPDKIVDLRQASATETSLRESAPGTAFLHLATHGFFAAADKKSIYSADFVSKQGEDRGGMMGEQRNVVRGYSPGQLSGLVFAGANRTPEPLTSESVSQSDSFDDGIMTADEIAYLRLEGTRLVVLSACETGLGEVAGGEGLLGIQRGFQLAGARSTIASLWKVNDAATRRVMQEFYTNYLEKEMSILDALQEAQLWALNHPNDVPRGAVVSRPEAKVVDATTEISERLSPQYWAPFILSGDWR